MAQTGIVYDLFGIADFDVRETPDSIGQSNIRALAASDRSQQIYLIEAEPDKIDRYVVDGPFMSG